MRIAMTAAVLISASAFAEDISPHLVPDIQRAVSTSDAAARVTVISHEGAQAYLQVDQHVSGTLDDALIVPARSFAQRDVVVGTQLLVFFRRGAPTGYYELITDGRIRDVSAEMYVEKVAEVAAARVSKTKAAVKVKAPRTLPAVVAQRSST
jgi:hypothetical protein